MCPPLASVAYTTAQEPRLLATILAARASRAFSCHYGRHTSTIQSGGTLWGLQKSLLKDLVYSLPPSLTSVHFPEM